MATDRNDSTASAGCDVCPMLRRRLSDLEEAVERYIVVMNETGSQRVDALKPVIDALATDFKTAILSSADMTDEQRAYWLAESARHESSQEEATS